MTTPPISILGNLEGDDGYYDEKSVKKMALRILKLAGRLDDFDA